MGSLDTTVGLSAEEIGSDFGVSKWLVPSLALVRRGESEDVISSPSSSLPPSFQIGRHRGFLGQPRERASRGVIAVGDR